MAEVKKIPYYTMKRSIFRGKVWKENDGLEGAVPINTPQKTPIIVARLVK
ncbi:hypothetical protein ALO71_04470 [Pseudomonas amygdali pv. dendropanacis]|uniref:Uncharacterized protein n=1 Tax=Pseudomonas amygdali pv. dendropanacis TaxID=235272 RepID=A0A0P9PH08_PSEA0|nr:hypothetical protein ALO71_04470 [Pseudomonas amygdali pv. dendropanacis]